MQIELGYHLFIHACSENNLGNIFLLFFLYFQIFFLKRPNSVSGCPDGMVASSRRPFSLFGRACLYDLLRGTMSGRHLSSVWPVNPVGLNCFPPDAARHSSPSLCSFCRLVHFPCDFYAYFSRACVLFTISLLPMYDFFPFYYFLISFMLIILITKGLIIFGSMWFKHVNFMHLFSVDWVEILSLSKLWSLIMVFM
jgi:hypothetical protein